jgi:hypothetical protein
MRIRMRGQSERSNESEWSCHHDPRSINFAPRQGLGPGASVRNSILCSRGYVGGHSVKKSLFNEYWLFQ